MNRQSLRKSELKVVRIRPITKRFDSPYGPELPQIDDDWKIGRMTVDGIPIQNMRTNHETTLGYDQIHHFTEDPRRGKGFGFLRVTVQLLQIGETVLCIGPNVISYEHLNALRNRQGVLPFFEG